MRRRVVLSVAATCLAVAAAPLAAPAHGADPAPGREAEAGGRASGVLSGRIVELGASLRRGDRDLAAALSVAPQGTGSLARDGAGRVLVQVLLSDTSAATVAALQRIGTVRNVSAAMSRVTLLVAPTDLASLGTVAAVRYADLVPAPMTNAATAGAAPARSRGVCGAPAGEADTQLSARKARSTFGVDGTGVMVGVLSDSYDAASSAPTTAAADVRSGALPGTGNPCGRTDPVRVVEEYAGGGAPTDEGRAMLQGVHGLAPGAGLAFATASGGPDVLADNIRALAHAGADVIVDDYTYFTEPFFQPGVVDQAVSSVTDRGVVYVSSAGNSNTVLDGHDIASWETPASRLGTCPMVEVDPSYGPLGVCVQFDPGGTDPGYGLTVGSGGTITPVLQWAEPFYGVTDDFDLFLVDPATHEVLAQSTTVQAKSRTPVEWLSWTNSAGSERAVELVVNRYSGPGAPRLKLAFVRMSRVLGIEHAVSQGVDVVGPTIFGHNGGADTLSVAAVPYDDPASVEPYSARGPVTHYFGPVRWDRPAAALRTPVRVGAPQVAATDGYGTTFFGSPSGGTYRFYGTSAAAPAAAAIAALVRSANPGLGPSRTRSALQRTAHPVPGAPSTAVGAGLLDAYAALALVRPPGPAAVTATTVLAKVAGSVRVRFTAPTSLPTAPVTGFDARCRSSDGGSTVSTARPGTSTAALVLTGLGRGRTYRCSVRARTSYGPGAYSREGTAVLARGVPSKPRRVVGTSTGRRVVLHFRAPHNTGGVRLTQFVGTCRAHGQDRTATARRSASSLVLTGLDAPQRYTCTVRATNRYGASNPSHATRVRVRG